ncbi:phospholipid phosphatase 2-like [Cuculus canorus]|uniref:phospholipid phosphatase 2-like n=1 Tax=Cuculus canorus TaxID=55661 RepID=UPI0023AA4A97|nr:phospholipid phosphatase 2-like [Cuculus canorus]
MWCCQGCALRKREAASASRPWEEDHPYLTLVNSPYQRGFYCNDDSIRYPYKVDTITHGLMAGVTIPCTVAIISTGEAYLVYTERLYSKSEFNNYLAALYKPCPPASLALHPHLQQVWSCQTLTELPTPLSCQL